MISNDDQTNQFDDAGRDPSDISAVLSSGLISQAERYDLSSDDVAKMLALNERLRLAYLDLAQSEARYRTLFEALDAGFCIIEISFDDAGTATDYHFVEVNPAFEAQTGIKGAAGQRMRSIAPEHEQHWFDTYGKVAKTRVPIRFENGAEALGRWFDVHAFAIGEPSAHRVALLFNDISDRKKAELALRESEQALQRLNETLENQIAERTADRDRMWRLSTDVMMVATHAAVITAINPAWHSMLGWSETDLIGTVFLDLLHPDDIPAAASELKLMARTPTPQKLDLRFLHKTDGYRCISWTVVPDECFIHGVGRDVTEERKRAEALLAAESALRQAQKMEAVGQLTGGVAHDFNNLLTIIRSASDLLRRPDLSEERRRRYIDAISDTADRAAKLTGQLLAFSRRQALKPEVFDAATRINGITDMLTSIVGARVKINIDAVCSPCFLEADASQFETAIVNMAVNARDAMDGEGTLTVCIEAVSEIPKIRGHTPVAGRFIAVSVRDTGSGIASDRIDNIFEPFFTTKETGKGTGLGLSQVFGFAKQSGGDITVHSAEGQGATFTLYLPHVETPVVEMPADIESQRRQPLAGGQGRCILVVEDNIEVGTFSTQMLQDLGYKTTWAASGIEALEKLDSGGHFDAVFSDIVMPGMSGIELGHEIRQRFPNVPVVLTSGYSHVLADEGRHGFELLQKPYAVEELSHILRKAISHRP